MQFLKDTTDVSNRFNKPLLKLLTFHLPDMNRAEQYPI